MVVRHIDLYALEDLKRSRSVLFCDDERTAAWLALVLHHSGNAYRSVQLSTDSLYTSLACICLRHPDAKHLIKELLDIVAEFLNLRRSIKIFIIRIVTRYTGYYNS